MTTKNILVFSDGTGQVGGLRPDQRVSNVYKLYRSTRPGPLSSIDPEKQQSFYDPGLGTITDESGIHLGIVDKFLSVFGLATGLGITENIIDCYAAILKKYNPGDRICLFGFSRGAYTVRCVAGVLKYCGVPSHDASGNPLPTDGPALRKIAREAVVGVYEHDIGLKAKLMNTSREKAAIAFREKYGSDGGATGASNVAPTFIGVFDTVAALGARGLKLFLLILVLLAIFAAFSLLAGRILEVLFGFSFWMSVGISFLVSSGFLGSKLFRGRWKAKSYDMSLDPNTTYARHARSIDETRADFDVVGWGHSRDVQAEHREHPPWLAQVWFAGNHSDIGGSYPEDESRLSDIALEWMLGEISARVPILIDRDKLNIWGSPDGIQHCEVQNSKEIWWRPTWTSTIRHVDPKAVLHQSVFERFALPRAPHCREWKPYRPEALRHHEKVSQYYID